MKKAVITGMGVVAGNAIGKDAFYHACTDGISGIKKCTAFDTAGLMTEYFGQADVSDENRLYDLIRLAADEMLKDSGYTPSLICEMGTKCRLFLGTLLSATDAGYKHSLDKKNGIPDCGTLARMNDYISDIRNLFGIRGTAYISSAACASGTTAAGMAFDYIRNGICDIAVMGGVDPLTIVAAYGFNALKSLSCSICNPYDELRDGINIGECGAFFMVESLEHALQRNAHIYCEIAGYGLGNDAYHATSPDPEGNGAYHTMISALQDGGISPNDVDYINGHGTGTKINDAMEIKAMEKLFENSVKKPAISSTKALIGHCMGASGASELASVILSMQHGKYIPMPKLSKPVSDKFFMSDKTAEINIQYALSNSFAFGGNSASLLIKEYDGGK
ncbi:MAG: beta-ketoacyl-[acyl-carrier-protein] synthase family protein [Ruminococcus sp.]